MYDQVDTSGRHHYVFGDHRRLHLNAARLAAGAAELWDGEHGGDQCENCGALVPCGEEDTEPPVPRSTVVRCHRSETPLELGVKCGACGAVWVITEEECSFEELPWTLRWLPEGDNRDPRELHERELAEWRARR